MTNITHVVKRERAGFATLIASGDLAYCKKRADQLNSDYQTDEYRVEPWRLREGAV